MKFSWVEVEDPSPDPSPTSSNNNSDELPEPRFCLNSEELLTRWIGTVPAQARLAGAELIAGAFIPVDSISGHRAHSLFKIGPNFYTSVLQYARCYRWRKFFRNVSSTSMSHVWSRFIHDTREHVSPEEDKGSWKFIPEMSRGEFNY